MRLFAYYALHSFKNQLRKLFKTWVLIFILVCFLIGIIIGIGAARIEEMAEENSEPVQEEIIEDWEDPELWEDMEDWEDGAAFSQALAAQMADTVELIAGGVLLAVLLFEILSADKSAARLFLPADVNLLFASPMEPQSVLMFRVYTQLGTGLIAGLYMLFQLPNLTLNAGLSMPAALSLVGAWCLIILLGKLIQVLLYLVCSAHPGAKANLSRAVYILLGVVGLAYGIFWKASGLDPLPAAMKFLNNPIARCIPVWGWIKGFIRSAIEGNTTGTLLWLALCVLGGAALVFLIRRTKADFYEDAMAKSEETAELLERARSEKSSALVFKKRDKDRPDKLRRDGFTHGRGANVFFFKSLYNRFRFAHLGFLTKTTETYIAVGVGMALLCRFVLEVDTVIPVALALSALAFFRSLGNPLEEDTKTDFFRMIPESTWAKLFWSLMGGGANCLLDALPALVIGALILGDNLLSALVWLPFILSVDLYATCVGTFIDLSVPVSGGKTIKQLVQVMFIYFGLLPDIGAIAVGMATDHAALGAIAAAGINLALGLVFFFLSPLFLMPRSVPVQAPAGEVDLGAAKSRFSRLGLGAFTILMVAMVLQVVLAIVLPESAQGAPWYLWVVTFAPQYLVAFPLGLWVMGRVPATPREQRSFGPGRFLAVAVICIFLMYAGNLVGVGVNTLLGTLLGVSPENPLESFATQDSLALRVLFMVVLAPLFEELIFRKTLIDRMHIYGEKLAVVTSAVMFGLFHGNFSQLFYAVALGLVFGYVYLKTGRLRYSVALHMFVNFLGTILGPTLMEGDQTVFYVYAFVLVAAAIAGLVTLCIKSRSVTFDPAPLELPKEARFKTAYLNAGMILLLLACLALIVLTLFS